MNRDGPRRRAQTAQPVMIVERVAAFQMHDLRPDRIDRQGRHPPPGTVEISGGPAARVQLHRHPLGAQREQLGHLPLGIAQDLHIGVAMQQHMRRHRLQQRLPLATRRDQRDQFGMRGAERRIGQPARHHPHRALRHRIAEIALAHLGFIRRSRPRQGHSRPGQPQPEQRTRSPPPGLATEHPHDRTPLALPRHGRWQRAALAEGSFHIGRPWRRAPSTTASRRSPSPFRGGSAHKFRIPGGPRPDSISSVSAQTSASARSGERPGPS